MSYYITHSGVKINVDNISANDINLKDIAHHLTKICRYGGALPLGVHYSVAQHSVQLANYAKKNGMEIEVQKALLLHDATEAYLGDIVSGLKVQLKDYQEIEQNLAYTIYLKYNLGGWSDKTIKELDTRIVLDEAKAFIPHYYYHFKDQLPDLEPLGITPVPEKNLEDTYHLFLYWCNKLDIKD